MTIEHKAIRTEVNESFSHWRYRDVRMEYERDQRQWEVTLYLDRGWANMYATSKERMMRKVDQALDERGFVPYQSCLYTSSRKARLEKKLASLS